MKPFRTRVPHPGQPGITVSSVPWLAMSGQEGTDRKAGRPWFNQHLDPRSLHCTQYCTRKNKPASKGGFYVVEPSGIEPLTSSLRIMSLGISRLSLDTVVAIYAVPARRNVH